MVRPLYGLGIINQLTNHKRPMPTMGRHNPETKTMPTKTFNTETYSRLMDIAAAIQTSDSVTILGLIDQLIDQKTRENKSAWVREMGKLKAFIAGDITAPWPIFKLDGNGKLPFATFSSLPGVTCPGAGSCLDWCYSFKAWRYPAAFARMAQNAWLMRVHPDVIEAALDALPNGITLRLYVDGDFANVRDVSFWMSQLSMHKDIAAYGYSKSFRELLAYARLGLGFPSNYILNLSGGHAHGMATVEEMRALPITRGTFDAVSIGRKVKSNDHGTRDTNKAIRAAVSGNVFPCPGKCGSCTPKGHACGSDRFRGIPIAIAVH